MKIALALCQEPNFQKKHNILDSQKSMSLEGAGQGADRERSCRLGQARGTRTGGGGRGRMQKRADLETACTYMPSPFLQFATAQPHRPPFSLYIANLSFLSGMFFPQCFT